MITSYVLHPSLFCEALTERLKEAIGGDALIKETVRRRADDINCILLGLSNRLPLVCEKLVCQYNEALESMPEHTRPHVEILSQSLMELAKDLTQSDCGGVERKQYVNCSSTGEGDVAFEIYEKYRPDTLLASSSVARNLENKAVSSRVSAAAYEHSSIMSLADYADSDVEKKRRMEAEEAQLSILSVEEVERRFARFLRYAHQLIFYDPQLIQADNRENFRMGIKFTLDILKRVGIFKDERISIKFVTREKKFRIPRGEDEESRRIRAERRENAIQCEQEYRDILIGWAKEEYARGAGSGGPWEIETIVLPMRVDFHGRHLRTEYGIMSVDRGFDFINRLSGDRPRSFKKCEVKIATTRDTWRLLKSFDEYTRREQDDASVKYSGHMPQTSRLIDEGKQVLDSMFR